MIAPPEDLGAKRYAFGQTLKTKKTDNGRYVGKRNKIWRSPAAVYMFVVAALLVFWFFYSFIAALANGGGWQTLLDYLSDFFALAVCVAIVICTAFGLWGKLARFALEHGMVKKRDIAQVEATAEMTEAAYEKAQEPSPVFEVYDGYIRASDKGVISIYDRDGIKKIKAYEIIGYYCIAMTSKEEYGFNFVCLHGLKLPLREVKKLKKIFGDIMVIEPNKDGAAVKKRKHQKVERERADWGSVKAGGIVMGLICALAGGGVIALHFYLAEGIPIVLGAFFIAGGALAIFTSFDSVPVVRVFVIPLFFGGILSVIPALFAKIIAEGSDITTAFTSVHHFLCSFNALYCAVGFLEAIGLLVLIFAFYSLIKFIKYGE